MLVLNLKPGESVHIDGDNHIRICIVKSSTGGVKIGFDAPADQKIYRERLWEQEHNRRAAAAFARNVGLEVTE